ncbi:MAG: low molecular weight phosphotyrosine protein phosphatase [Bacteroidetes bacterium]|nr:low molecular weight phosphotyrosine protein phosphatase [Bacteroidota bacterium]
MKILFVCLGNICRSPIAEGVLQKMVSDLNLAWVIDSAGTESFHIGEHPHKYSQQVCKEHGIDISTQRARRFTSADMDKFDKIYVMASDVYEEVKEIAGAKFDGKKVDYFLNEFYPLQNKTLKDPWYGDLSGYYKVYEEVEKTCDAIIKKFG